jgi:NADPH:quinone reductase
MNAIQVKQVGGPDAMELVDLPAPQPKPSEALVKLAASGVNFIDVYVREGRYKAQPPYTQSDFEVETRKLTGGTGVDVVYDSVGKTTFEKGLNVLLPRGMMVLFGGSSGAVPPFDLIGLQKGSLYVTRPRLLDYTATRDELIARSGAVLGMIAAGKLKLRIEHTYPLAEAQRVHRDLEGRKTTGKLLLIP